MPKTKDISLDSRKRIVDAHEAGDGYTKLSQRFQVSRIGPRNSKTDKTKKHGKDTEGSERFPKPWKEKQ